MNADQVRLLRETWSQVRPIREQAAELFYGRLFELDPSTRQLFTGDMRTQGQNLMAMIGFVVNNLDDLDLVVTRVGDLGRKHADFGVTESHYDTVAQALLWTLDQGLGDAYTPAVADAWTTAYTVLADTMKAAARDVVPAAH